MDKEKTVAILKELITSREAIIEKIHKRRGWRPSEKAMSALVYKDEIEALRFAIIAVEEVQ